ncbi:ABC transporter substrate-binding protein [Fontivita pretiosa]|uniref:ABC transporter substrate-binding protein n=1 Tax=Fontivita pretiosa TaxID=2989684 RepID=UPI003D16A4C3
MDFPYGKAPLAILMLAIVSGVAILFSGSTAAQRKPDLIFATFTKEHAAAYRPAIAEFEKQHNVQIQLQVVDQRALQGRLQSALQVGADVPDMVELLDNTMGIFTRGPIEDVGFVDLTERVKSSGLYDKLVNSRFGKWSSRGHIFALPHDVHPTMLAYRKDLLDQLGIDVTRLTTWEEFCRVGREVTQDLTGDGVPDRYMIDLPAAEPWALRLLLLQRGVTIVNEAGEVAFDDERAVDVFCWYIRQIQGPDRISFPCGWGQNLAKSMIDGLCLFYICPDWRTRQFQMDVPSLAGKMSLIPLPAWEPGGIRTSTWGGTGLAFTKRGRNFELAWKLAMYLYYDPEQLGPRFADTNILPPLVEAWDQPEFHAPRDFYCGIRLGKVFAELAPQVPVEYANAYMTLAEGKMNEAFANAALYHREHGEQGLREYVRSELKRCADRVRVIMNRNVFLKEDAAVSAGAATGDE